MYTQALPVYLDLPHNIPLCVINTHKLAHLNIFPCANTHARTHAHTHTHTHTHTRRCRSTISEYDKHAIQGSDEWGKQFFHNTPFSDDAPYYAGLVTPVIHYCMGGLAISADGRCV
jgi:succinate dehydrogenase/fumarate reductase flavoprotein subunit